MSVHPYISGGKNPPIPHWKSSLPKSSRQLDLSAHRLDRPVQEICPSINIAGTLRISVFRTQNTQFEAFRNAHIRG